MLSSGRETNKPYFGNRAQVHGVLQQVNDRPPSPVHGVANVSVMVRLTSVTVRSLAGLPDLEVVLQPLTALIGPRGSGKSRLVLAARLLAELPRINARDDKVLAAWRRFSTMAPGRIPAVFRAIIETTVALATGNSGG